ncbi:MAG: ATP-dependent helicase [Anaerolineae bacterium]|nr:ATP-dependent helicase [Anaerolineae bacterium]
MTLPFIPRPSQEQILRYTGGRLGIAAVPGAGKTQILSALAAQIIASGVLGDDQEVLIVTLVNSAVDNFEARIKRFFDNPLHALYKYRVRTLHGLAHDIVREKPARVGLEERFAILDEREADFIRREAVNAFLSANSTYLDDYLDPALEESKRDWVRRQQLPDMMESLALAFIRSAKDRRLTPDKIRSLLDQAPAPLPLAAMGLTIYSDYQRALAYRGAVDFDDLIRLALDLLENDDEFLERLRHRYPFILEDEAQDSSISQERILNLLSGGASPSRAERSASEVEAGRGDKGEGGNWVRVGDPNQAIFETFTTASPELLRDFIRNNNHVDMNESGRSQQFIIDLANHLIDWVMTEHPASQVRTALETPYIEPVPEDDPQRNPPEDKSTIRFAEKRYTPEEETEAVVKSIQKWLPENMDKTVAVLVPRNQRGVEVIDALKKKGIEVIEFLASTSNTRAAAGALNYLLSYLADPQSSTKLSRAYQVFRRDIFGTNRKGDPSGSNGDSDEIRAGRPYAERASTLLRKMIDVENFIAPRSLNPYPSPTRRGAGVTEDWLAAISEEEPEQVIQELSEFRVNVRRWLEAVTLPIDQLVLTLAQDVFTQPADLALSLKLALVLRQVADDHAEWRLPELAAELAVIAKNERRFIGFSTDDSGFDPNQHRGKVVVTTVHKAKGLEWDRVYLMSVNNYDFPSGEMYDRYISEKWFLRGGLNLEAEALAQLKALESTNEYDWYEEGNATMQSRLDYVKERLRLLYVGITRAKSDLIITWNSGRTGDAQPSLAMSELMGWWEVMEKGM